ncbi:phage baseplate assembly protein V [Vibrio mangrovi]|uniref:Phage baseplate assembly protein V n=1 Tax=Vibrio mangrovi TaxID=474394 RepID=A0A1Y6ITQ8_9VIBR|nr:phage baseplate assembly protein V [Vibrio mangrovi]MDW6004727.1 phage baseplate assembly protein V [Vibrio mangrovi]SMS01018.1 Phage-related baseplate assembly protein [Vibrio mangrovi]
MSEFTQAQLVRLISDMIQVGVIIEVQAKPLRYKVRFTPDLYTDWIPANVGHAGQVKDWQPLQEGEQVMVLKQFNTQSGVIIASLNQTSFDQPKEDLNRFYREFPDGTWLEYDMESHLLSGKITGKVNLEVDQQFRVQAPKIVLVGDIEHDGSQKSTGDIADGVRSMAADRSIYNTHTHTHGVPMTTSTTQRQ